MVGNTLVPKALALQIGLVRTIQTRCDVNA